MSDERTLWTWGTHPDGGIAITVCEGRRPIIHITDVDLDRMVNARDGEKYVVDLDYVCAQNESDGTWMCRVGKKAAGRLLDGRVWDETPGGRT